MKFLAATPLVLNTGACQASSPVWQSPRTGFFGLTYMGEIKFRFT